MTNRYPGSCGRCGAKVPAGQGIYDPAMGVTHTTEAECKTTTKTYQSYLRSQAHHQFQDAIQAAFRDAGMTVLWSQNVDHATVIYAGDVVANVGGYSYRDGNGKAQGVRIFRRVGGNSVEDTPLLVADEPRVDTGDFYADQLAAQAMLIDMIRGCQAA